MRGVRDLLGAIGNTPLVRLRCGSFGGATLLAKLEGHNPGGSVKDRPAAAMLQGAIARGELRSGDALVEATSGNTGIALAMLAGSFGLYLTLVMPEDATVERVKTMRAYGAEIVLTSADAGIEASRERAEAMVAAGSHAGLNQFANPDNPMAHETGTGPEIWRDTDGRVTHFVSAMGTTGTITGTGRYLKAQNDQVQVIGTRPTEGSRIPGIRRWAPAFLPAIFEPQLLDRTLDVSQAEAEAGARRLAATEGIFAGVSSGGAFAAAERVAASLPEPAASVIVFIACDRGDRYLSDGPFA